MTDETVDQKARWRVAPAQVRVSFSAVIPPTTVVDHSVQDRCGDDVSFRVGLEWFEALLSSRRMRDALARQAAFSAVILAIEAPLGVPVALPACAGLRSIPDACRQAARIDRAGRRKVCRHVEPPKMQGAPMIAILLRFMDGFMIRTEPFVAIGGRAGRRHRLPLDRPRDGGSGSVRPRPGGGVLDHGRPGDPADGVGVPRGEAAAPFEGMEIRVVSETICGACVDDPDPIGTRWRRRQGRNLTDWMANDPRNREDFKAADGHDLGGPVDRSACEAVAELFTGRDLSRLGVEGPVRGDMDCGEKDPRSAGATPTRGCRWPA